MTAPTTRRGKALEWLLHAYTEEHEPFTRHMIEEAVAEARAEGAAALGVPMLDLTMLPEGWRVIVQRGDDYGTGPWYAVVENTIDLPDQDTARLGHGDSPQAAFEDALAAAGGEA